MVLTTPVFQACFCKPGVAILRRSQILDNRYERIQQMWGSNIPGGWTPREDEHLRRRFVEDSAMYSEIALELERPIPEVVRRVAELNLWEEHYSWRFFSEFRTKRLPEDGSECLCGATVRPDSRFCPFCGRALQ
jgi:hypothetical protein